jgi:hypothetical protein
MFAILVIFAIVCLAVAAFDEPSTQALALGAGRQVWVANAVVRSVAFLTAAFLLALASRI